MVDFHSSSTLLATFVVSVYILGFAFGPLIVAPLSEHSGRAIVYNMCNVLFLIFNIASAVASNMALLVIFRFLCGVAGVTPTTIGSGTIADLMPAESRGKAMALWSLGPLFGPIIGPVAGGYLIEATSWRWVFWLLAIVVRFFWFIQGPIHIDILLLLGWCIISCLLFCCPRNPRANPSREKSSSAAKRDRKHRL